MRKPEEIVADVASRIRKVEDMVSVTKKNLKIMEHELMCLHKALEEGMQAANLSVDGDGAVVYGGGTPKED